MKSSDALIVSHRSLLKVAAAVRLGTVALSRIDPLQLADGQSGSHGQGGLWRKPDRGRGVSRSGVAVSVVLPDDPARYRAGHRGLGHLHPQIDLQDRLRHRHWRGVRPPKRRFERRRWLFAGAAESPVAILLLFHVPVASEVIRVAYLATVFSQYMMVFANFFVH